MANIRRTYVYLVAAASLGFLIYGLIGVGTALLDLLMGGALGQLSYRQAIAENGAAIIVALPIWVLHWRWAQKLAANDPNERSAAIRRLYVYAVLGALIWAAGQAAVDMLHGALSPIAGGSDARSIGGVLARSGWRLAVAGAFWIYLFRIANDDREAVGEVAASATLRRWYAYGTQFVALVAALIGAKVLVQTVIQALFVRSIVVRPADSTSQAVALTLTGLGIWLFH
jgi:hypothetical protein